MNKMKRLMALLVVILSIFASVPMNTMAATTSCKTMTNGRTAYYSSKTVMYNQTYIEKCITVKKNNKKKVTPMLTVGSKVTNLHKYVRFVVWVYDCSNGKRVMNTVVQSGQSVTLPVSSKNKTYSVQIRPYMHTSAWNKYSTLLINSYVANPGVQYYLKY